jgi:hypothetical protein
VQREEEAVDVAALGKGEEEEEEESSGSGRQGRKKCAMEV